jgi:hypothetical protein
VPAVTYDDGYGSFEPYAYESSDGTHVGMQAPPEDGVGLNGPLVLTRDGIAETRINGVDFYGTYERSGSSVAGKFEYSSDNPLMGGSSGIVPFKADVANGIVTIDLYGTEYTYKRDTAPAPFATEPTPSPDGGAQEDPDGSAGSPAMSGTAGDDGDATAEAGATSGSTAPTPTGMHGKPSFSTNDGEEVLVPGDEEREESQADAAISERVKLVAGARNGSI